MRNRISWLLATVILAGCGEPGCKPDSSSNHASEDTGNPRLEGLGDGAILSAGPHDVVLVIHHAAAYTAADVDRQVTLATGVVEALAALQDAAGAGSADAIQVAVLEAGDQTKLVAPLGTETRQWRTALGQLEAYEPRGSVSLDAALLAAQAELVGERSRPAAHPVLVHFATRGAPLAAETRAGMSAAGVALVFVGDQAPALQPANSELVMTVVVPPNTDTKARLQGVLAWGHGPIHLKALANNGWNARLTILDQQGELLSRDAAGQSSVEASFAWEPRDQGAMLTLRVAATHPDHLDEERFYAATIPPQDTQPVVTRVTPAMAKPGDTITVSGRFFAATLARNQIHVGVTVSATTATKDHLQFTLPVDAADGTLTVSVDGVSSAPAALRVDRDGDGIPDNDELAAGTDPAKADTDGDGLLDGADQCPSQTEGAGNVAADGCTLCANHAQDGNESDIDCGAGCTKCPEGRHCRTAPDCTSGACDALTCLPNTCTDGLLDGDETAVDCGGACAPCPQGAACRVGEDCLSTLCTAQVCRPGSCDNQQQDLGETGVDCGGPCAGCALGAECQRDQDCQSGLCDTGRCEPSRCQDHVRNGGESDVDCGGPQCAGCATGQVCTGNGDCRDGLCRDNACVAPSCADGVRNGEESGKDCGGTLCARCPAGETCQVAEDCADAVCDTGVCAGPSCFDTVRNGTETDVDCGGSCDGCSLGHGCDADTDCLSGACQAHRCVVPECRNGQRDTAESDVDCGGPCAPCGAGAHCGNNADCDSARCNANLTCDAPTCGDTVRNQGESDADCGGPCPACADGRQCHDAADCTSQVCRNGACVPPACNDSVHNGTESAADCGGGCSGCAEGLACRTTADCAAGECFALVCVMPTCADGRRNGNEVDVDCGGSCPGCPTGTPCTAAAECRSGVCASGTGPDGGASPTGKVCLAPECTDQVKNGAEGDVDCGGECAPCNVGATCVLGTDCASQVCGGAGPAPTCQAPSCADGTLNGNEIDVDCGGLCPPCGDGLRCGVAGDCASGVCGTTDAGESRCAVPTCEDGIRNGGEGDVDCGSTCPALCTAGLTCTAGADCVTGVCEQGSCQAFGCHDGVLNGDEVGVDCGGSRCAGCPDGNPCAVPTDCESGVCDPLVLTCAGPVCWDQVHNGDETDVDCGGPCLPCGLGKSCAQAGDCASANCVPGAGGKVCGSSCTDQVQNGSETDVDCGGPSCSPCAQGAHCAATRDCGPSGVCGNGSCVPNTCTDQVLNGSEADVDCGGFCPNRCPTYSQCHVSSDCTTGWCHLGACERAPSCGVIKRGFPEAPTGVYSLRPLWTSDPVDVWCDMDAYEGGWTLVANAQRDPVEDRRAAYTGALASLAAGVPSSGVWGDLRVMLGTDPVDVRFTCKATVFQPAMDVDLTFFGVDWYQRITAGTDADSCFAVAGEPSWAPVRRNNLTGESLPAGQPWRGGNLTGERSCDDEASFTVDLEDSGLGGNPLDGTDWGEADGVAKCGAAFPEAGSWQVWIREPGLACANGVLDADEDGVDCGGPCEACPVRCTQDEDCPGSVCRGAACVVPRCDDRVQNGTESDVDCGGTCRPCGLGKACQTLVDCAVGLCQDHLCQAGTCFNHAKDGDETDVDCGGLCGPCAAGQHCQFPQDCVDHVCDLGVCRGALCNNNQQDATETDVDCGGPCGACALGQGCAVAADCDSNTCDHQRCVPATCADQTLSPGETDVDCGGTACAPCNLGKACGVGTDCASGVCHSPPAGGPAVCLPVCGNGVWTGIEECDDGNTADGDGCSSVCTVERGYLCTNWIAIPTGASGQGGRAAVGSNDLAWSWSATPGGERSPAVVSGNCLPGTWTDAPEGAQWINRSGCDWETPADTDTYYHVTFTTTSVVAAQNTVVTGRLWVDDVASQVIVNGVPVTLDITGANGPGARFASPRGVDFAEGLNVITWVVHNSAGSAPHPDGLLIERDVARPVCSLACSNGFLDPGEECDDGNTADGDGCSSQCKNEVCGDGAWNGNEECDDGNTVDGDGCTSTCQIEAGYNCVNSPNINTGSDLQGSTAMIGVRDLVWSYSETLEGPRVAAVVAGECAVSWTDPLGYAQWVNRYGCNQSTPGDTDTYYHATFTIPTGVAASHTVIGGTTWADNYITDILVNGVSTGTAHGLPGDTGFSGPGESFGDWPSSMYRAGVNTITVVVHNASGQSGNPDGLLVSVPDAFGRGSVCQHVP